MANCIEIKKEIVLNKNSYEYCDEIAKFNYEVNLAILKKVNPTMINKIEISNVLYITSLIEILGYEYIEWVKKTAINSSFMMTWDKQADTISKYIDYQLHSGCSYAFTMRIASEIILDKYPQHL